MTALATLGAGLIGAACTQPSFQGLGPNTQATRLSADGTTVISGRRRWTLASGWQNLGGIQPTATGVSADGRTVVGHDFDPNGSFSFPFRWTDTGGYQSLASSFSTFAAAFGVSPNGQLLVGYAGGVPIRMPVTGPFQGMGTIPGVSSGSARDITDDGSVAIGWCYEVTGLNRAASWNAAGTATELPRLPGHTDSRAYDLTIDGRYIVGNSFVPFVQNNAMLWGPGGMTNLGALTPDYSSSAYSVSENGEVVVGASDGRAFIWTPASGMQDLQQFLISIGLPVANWTLTAGRGVSADGLTIAGNGVNKGVSEAWIVTIPAPGALAAACMALVPLAMRRHRHPA